MRLFFIRLSPQWVVFDNGVKIIPFYRSDFGRLNALQVEKARRALIQAIKRSDKIPSKKELKSNVFPIVIEKQPQTTFTDQIEFIRNFALL